MLRAISFLLIAIVFIIVLTPANWISTRFARKIHRSFYKMVCRVLGIKINVIGVVPEDDIPKIFVSNHTSFADILVLGAVLPASFISKAEIARWPLIGHLARLMGTVFVNRKRSGIEKQMEEMTGKLKAGTNLILFPEGTTTNGRKAHGFKTSFFRLAYRQEFNNNIAVQPVSLSYTHAADMPNRFYEKKNYYWIGDMELMPSLKYFFGPSNTTVNVLVDELITSDFIKDTEYKTLAETSRSKVQNGLDKINENMRNV